MKGKKRILLEFAARSMQIDIEELLAVLEQIPSDRLSLPDRRQLAGYGIPVKHINNREELYDYLMLVGQQYIVQVKNSPSYDLYRAFNNFRRTVNKEMKSHDHPQ